MEYEFRQFGEGYHDRECFYWLYPVVRNGSPIGLVELVRHEWHVIEWNPRSGVGELRITTMPGDMPVDEVLGVAKLILLSLKE